MDIPQTSLRRQTLLVPAYNPQYPDARAIWSIFGLQIQTDDHHPGDSPGWCFFRIYWTVAKSERKGFYILTVARLHIQFNYTNQ